MPSKFNSTAKKPGKAVKKPYNRGGRTNLRDEEARVIGVQDNAADEMRRVKARRPNDAAERRDKRSQESRVGSRERNARDEMSRLRREAVGMGMKTGGRSPATTGRSSKAINQHKRMAMGENVLTGKMIKKADGGKIEKTKAPKRTPATSGVNINMGAPKSKVVQARGMGAAIKGGNFRTNT